MPKINLVDQLSKRFDRKAEEEKPVQKVEEVKPEPKLEPKPVVRQPRKPVSYSDTEVVGARTDDIQNYALRLPKAMYKGLKVYCDQKGITINTLIYNTLKARYENDPEYKDAYKFANKK